MPGASLLSPELAGILNRELSLQQQKDLAADLMEIFEFGHGHIEIEIRGHHIRFLRLRRSRDLTGNVGKNRMRAVNKD
jgi:hypothetical protein